MPGSAAWRRVWPPSSTTCTACSAVGRPPRRTAAEPVSNLAATNGHGRSSTPVTTPGPASSGSPQPVSENAPVLLGVDGVTVRFGGVVANDDVSMSCREGEITALLGPNGAGKSTQFDVITGARRPAAGTVTYAGDDITRLATQERARRGIGRTFQNLALARELSVFDNV